MRTFRLLTASGAGLLAVLLSSTVRADLEPEWIEALSVDSSLTAGLWGMTVDAAGVAYVTGTGGTSANTDVVTAAFDSDGTLLWSQIYNGLEDGNDQGRGIALGPDGSVHVCGNTPDSASYATVLLLEYEASTGELLDEIQYSSGPYTSEHGGSVVVDADGNVYVGGGTVGDGGDAMILKFDSDGEFQWKRVWDGPADAPYSQDTVLELLLDPDGLPVALIHGVMGSLQPDYVVFECEVADGSTAWEATWGVNGGDYPRDMEMDGDGDIYVTGTGIDGSNAFSTIKLDGTDGKLLWQEYDSGAARAHAIALDGEGGVYITGRVDPDGDLSNFNDNFLTVKRAAADGAFEWSHAYGDDCVGCYDVPADVIVDVEGNVFVAGFTSSDPYVADAITFVLDSGTGDEIERGVVSGEGATTTAEPRFLALDPSYNLLAGGDFYDADTGEVEMFVFRYASLTATSEPMFLRGDTDGSGATSVLLDALYLLQWGFLNGPAPACDDAADVDDSGAVQPLLDALALLLWGFAAGEIPPAPGPTECGVDTTTDALLCAGPTGCP